MADLPEIVGVRCSQCHAEYRHERNIINDKMVWVCPRPRSARHHDGKCLHAKDGALTSEYRYVERHGLHLHGAWHAEPPVVDA